MYLCITFWTYFFHPRLECLLACYTTLEIKAFGLSFYTEISLPPSPISLPSPLSTTKSYSVICIANMPTAQQYNLNHKTFIPYKRKQPLAASTM